MVNKIIDGVVLAINGEFGDECEIYTESVKQGLKEPCFFVRCIRPMSRLFRGKRYKHSHMYVINYFPASDTPAAELNDVTMRLFECLELITADGGHLRGADMSSEIDDGVLHFTVVYGFFTYKQEDAEAMHEYSQTTNTEG